MGLLLSARDIAALEAVQQALLSPFDFGPVDGWRSAVNRLAKQLLGADKATFRLPCPGVDCFTEDFEPGAYDGYPDRWSERGFDMQAVRRIELASVVWDRKTIHQMHLQRLYRTAYYELVVSQRAYDSIGLSIEPLRDGKLAGFIFHHERLIGPKFGGRGRELLRQLLPAFRTGVKTYLRLAANATQLAAALDVLSEGAVLFDAGGRRVHGNAALWRLLASDPERGGIEAALQALANELCRAVARRESLSQTAPASEVTTARARYRLRGALFGEGVFHRSASILVTVERVRPEPPGAGELAARFRLTPSEGEVALLLMQRRTNAEVARALGISPHTARHHTESVFLKMGTHSRTQAAELLKRAPGAPEAGHRLRP